MHSVSPGAAAARPSRGRASGWLSPLESEGPLTDVMVHGTAPVKKALEGTELTSFVGNILELMVPTGDPHTNTNSIELRNLLAHLLGYFEDCRYQVSQPGMTYGPVVRHACIVHKLLTGPCDVQNVVRTRSCGNFAGRGCTIQHMVLVYALYRKDRIKIS